MHFFLENPPKDFFKQQNDHSRTYSAEEIQKQMRGALRRSIERGVYFEGIGVGFMVGHEPVLSLSMVDLTGKAIDEIGGKFKELETATLYADIDKSISYPTTVLKLRDQEYDVTEKIFGK